MQMLKRALIAYVDSIKTVWSAFAHPLSIESKRKGMLKDYRVYGNSIQSGTPTPDSPIEVQSVGVKTNNLFNIKEFEENLQYGYILDDNGTPLKDKFSAYSTYRIPTKEGQTIFISGAFQRVYFYDKDDNFIERTIAHYGINKSYIIKQDGCIRLQIQHAYWDSKKGVEQVLISPTLLDYEPFGYKIPVTVRGKNLLDVNSAGTKTVTVSGITVEPYGMNGFHVYGVPTTTNNIVFRNGAETTRYRTYIKKDTVLKTSVHLDKTYNNILPSGTRVNFQCSLYGVNYNWLVNASTPNAIKIPEDAYAIGYNTLILATVDTEPYLDFVFYPQVEVVESTTSTATSYEPYIEPQTFNLYLNEPLRKTGEYADCIDSGKKADVHKVGVTKVKNLSWSKQSNFTTSDGTVLYRYEAKASKKRNFVGSYSSVGKLFCTGLKNVAYGPSKANNSISERYVESTSSTGMGRHVRILTSEYSTVSDMLSAFGEFDIYYILDDAYVTEEPIDLPKLPQFKGTTIYEVQSDITPSGIEVCYIA